jgi:hypothetical protein
MDEFTDTDPADEITRLEELIESLSARINHCRKIALLARALLVGSGLLAAAALIGLIRFDGLLLAVTIAAALGGVVLLGSNRTSAADAEARRAEAETRRAELISAIPLRVVH